MTSHQRESVASSAGWGDEPLAGRRPVDYSSSSLNERDEWVQLARQMSMPLAGGISGTTARLMRANVMLGSPVSAANTRFAAMGYLIPIHAHSCHEIATAAASWVPYGAGSYDNIAPLSGTELAALSPPASAQARGVV